MNNLCTSPFLGPGKSFDCKCKLAIHWNATRTVIKEILKALHLQSPFYQHISYCSTPLHQTPMHCNAARGEAVPRVLHASKLEKASSPDFAQPPLGLLLWRWWIWWCGPCWPPTWSPCWPPPQPRCWVLTCSSISLSWTKVSFRFSTTFTFTWLFAVKMTNVEEDFEQLLNGNLKAEFKIGELKGRQILKKSHEGS